MSNRMSASEYQRACERTVGPTDQRERLGMTALGLAGESGEVIELVKKHLYHGKPLDLARMGEELGDVCWYLAVLCTTVGLDLEAVMAANIAKLRARYPQGFDREGGK